MFADQIERGLVPVGQHQHGVVFNGLGDAGAHPHRRGAVAVAIRRREDEGVVMGAVVAAVEGGDFGLARERPGGAHGAQGRLRAAVEEHHLVRAWRSLLDQFSQFGLAGVGDAEMPSLGQLRLDGRGHRRRPVAEHAGAETHGQVDVGVAVHIGHGAAVRRIDVDRMWQVNGAHDLL